MSLTVSHPVGIQVVSPYRSARPSAQAPAPGAVMDSAVLSPQSGASPTLSTTSLLKKGALVAFGVAMTLGASQAAFAQHGGFHGGGGFGGGVPQHSAPAPQHSAPPPPRYNPPRSNPNGGGGAWGHQGGHQGGRPVEGGRPTLGGRPIEGGRPAAGTPGGHAGGTTVINNTTVVQRNTVVNVHDHFRGERGPDWDHHHGPWGYYYGGGFLLGFDMGLMIGGPYYPYPWYEPPVVYVFSPVSQCDYGQVPVPAGGFQDQKHAQLAILDVMATPQQSDPTAGLYKADKHNPDQPGQKLSGPAAFNELRHKKAVFFHPPNGAYEQLTNLDDLDAYIYEKQNNVPPPAPTPPPTNSVPTAPNPS